MRGVIDEVRLQGWSILDQELEVGLRSLSAPIGDGQGKIVVALDVCCASMRITPEDLRTRVLAETLAASNAITRALQILSGGRRFRSGCPRSCSGECGLFERYSEHEH